MERARWTGRLDNEGQEVNAGDVALEALVSTSGLLMREDGATPADGEILTLQKLVQTRSSGDLQIPMVASLRGASGRRVSLAGIQ